MAIDFEAMAAASAEAEKNKPAPQPVVTQQPQEGASPDAPAPVEGEDTRGIGETIFGGTNPISAAGDILKGAAGGVERAVRGVREVGKAVTGDEEPLPPPLIEDPKGMAGQFAQAITQFGIGWGGAGLAIKGVGLAAKLGKVGTTLASQGIGTAIVADSHAPNLSNILEQFPILQNPVMDFLSSKPDDSIAAGKFKAAIQDMGLQAAGSTLYKIVVGTKAAEVGNKPLAEAMQKAVLKEVDPAAAKLAGVVDEVVPPVTAEAKAAAEEAAKPVHEVLNDVGMPIFSLNKEQHQLFSDQVGAMARTGNVEDISRSLSSMFNHENMTSTHDVQRAVESLSNIMAPELDKQGLRQLEVMSNKQTEQAAFTLGVKPEEFLRLARPMAVNADSMAKVVTAGNSLIQSLGYKVAALASRAYVGNDEEAVKALLRIHPVYDEIMGLTAAIRTGSARATQAGNIKTGVNTKSLGPLDAMGKRSVDFTPQEIESGKILAQRIMLSNDNKGALAVLRSTSLTEKIIDTHNEFWINGILSGFKTHVVNVVSAGVKTLAQPFNQIVGGVLTRSKEDVKEGIALYRGLRTEFFDAATIAWRAMKTDTAILDPGKGSTEYFNRAITAANYKLSEGSHLATGVDFLGKIIRFPGRFLTAEDEFFKQINYRAKLKAGAGREAEGLVQAGKLDRDKMVDMVIDGEVHKVSEVEKYVHDRFESNLNPAAQEAANEGRGLLSPNAAAARKYAREATFTQDLNIPTNRVGGTSIGADIQRVASSHPLLRGTILPFVKVPTNIMRDFVDHSLLAPLTARFKQDVAAGGSRKSVAIGKLATGSMLSVSAMFLAMEGRITGAAPGDKDMKARVLESGWQPYSVVFGSKDKPTYISLQRLDPWGMMFGLTADFYQTAHHLDDESKHNFAVALSLAIANNIESKSYLQGIAQFTALFGGGYDKESKVESYIQQRLASYIPSYTNLFSGNEEMKQLRTWYDGMLAKMPGWSGLNTVEAKRDWLTGEKKLSPDGYPANALNPFTVSEDKGDAVRTELARLSQGASEAKFSQPDAKLGTIDLSTIKNASGQSAYDRWTELIGQTKAQRGQTLHERLGDVMASDRYKNGTDGTSYYNTGSRVTQIKETHEAYKAKAQQLMLKEFADAFDANGQPVNLRRALVDDQGNAARMKAARGLDKLKDVSNLR